ncbi:hypothetical protein, partial [Bacteroides acidifaciens]|uniref:hypothetical protein n=1 Tax=Bacteroides acidifaciens TaxID=85831 RepID=UPI0025A4E75D
GQAHPYCICGFHATNLTLSEKLHAPGFRLEPIFANFALELCDTWCLRGGLTPGIGWFIYI